jgi:hypothetical protein
MATASTAGICENARKICKLSTLITLLSYGNGDVEIKEFNI